MVEIRFVGFAPQVAYEYGRVTRRVHSPGCCGGVMRGMLRVSVLGGLPSRRGRSRRGRCGGPWRRRRRNGRCSRGGSCGVRQGSCRLRRRRMTGFDGFRRFHDGSGRHNDSFGYHRIGFLFLGRPSFQRVLCGCGCGCLVIVVVVAGVFLLLDFRFDMGDLLEECLQVGHDPDRFRSLLSGVVDGSSERTHRPIPTGKSRGAPPRSPVTNRTTGAKVVGPICVVPGTTESRTGASGSVRIPARRGDHGSPPWDGNGY